MDFGDVLKLLKIGKLVARSGWNGKGMYIFLGTNVSYDVPVAIREKMSWPHVLDCIVMRTANGDMCPGWLASQTDMLAEDWQEVDL